MRYFLVPQAKSAAEAISDLLEINDTLHRDDYAANKLLRCGTNVTRILSPILCFSPFVLHSQNFPQSILLSRARLRKAKAEDAGLDARCGNRPWWPVIVLKMNMFILFVFSSACVLSSPHPVVLSTPLIVIRCYVSQTLLVLFLRVVYMTTNHQP